MNKMDLHIHTAQVSPCGSVTAKDLVELYHEKGYEGLVITDHYFKGFFEDLVHLTWEQKIHHFLEGYKVALHYGSQFSMTILLGMEIRLESDPNDYLVYGIDEEFLIHNPKLYDLSVSELLEKVREHHLMIFQAHPFRKGMHRNYIPLLDGFECYNGNRRHDSGNLLAEKFLEETQLIGISGSDFHELEDLAYGGIVLQHKVESMEQLMRVLKSKEFKVIKEGELV